MISAFSNLLATTAAYSSITQEAALLSIPQANLTLNDDLQSSTVDTVNHSPSIAYKIGTKLGRWLGTRTDESDKKESDAVAVKSVRKLQKISSREIPATFSSKAEPFSSYYNQLFPQDTLRILYLELDPGVDDGMALVQFLAAAAKNTGSKESKKVEIVGIVPCVGNTELIQTEQNTMQFLMLTENQNIGVYPGAIAPLAIENNQTAIDEMNQAINATHFYGHDGESNVGGWPKVTMQMQTTPGYKFAADQISQSSPDKPLILISTAALTELSKTFTELANLEAQNGLTPGAFAKNINAISIMGGCLSREAGCNAPFDVPDDQKNSEANFYFDSPAAQHVFSVCQQYNITILQAPLDLTQQPGLLWTKEQVSALQQIPNPVSQQMAGVTAVIPYLDAPCFLNGTYPMHDLQAATCLLFPDFYTVTRIAAAIGSVGQMIIDPNATDAQKNIYVLEMSAEKQAAFYGTVLNEYHNFDCIAENNNTLSTRCKPEPVSRGLSTKALTGLVAGVASLALCVLSAVGISQCRRQKRSTEVVKETDALLSNKSISVLSSHV
ncbi:MAG: inosine-uridine preferring nucleoside hydrolase [Chlamydiia bacterium]|nr:inosine-uridine preferring nucleoside hydrolase [Chlamydiia bacterium]